MRSFTTKNIFTLVLLTAMLVVGGGGMVKGQGIGRVYAQYLNLSGTKGTAGTGGLGGALGDYSIDNPSYMNNNDLTAYAELKATSGTGAVLGTGGGATTAVLNLNFPGGASVSSGTQIIIKLSAENKDNLTIAAYNSSGILVASAAPLTSNNSVQEFAFTVPAAFSTIRITSITGLSGLLGVPTTNNVKIYYAYYLPAPVLKENNVTMCGGNSVSLEVANPDPLLTYKWYDAATAGNLVNTGSTYNIVPTISTNLYVETATGTYASQSRTAVSVTVNPLPTLKVTTPAITIPEATNIVTVNAVSNAVNIKWYDHLGRPAGSGLNVNIVPPSAAGTYNYTVIVDNGNGTCSNSANLTISVFSTTICPPLTQRVYADDASVTSGNVTNAGAAADKDPKTSSLLTSPVSLLGLGAATQSLTWNNRVDAGTPVTIKFGPGTNLLGLGSGISVVAFQKNGNVITNIGGSQSMNAALLTLLPGSNILEYTFVPSNASGAPQSYDGIKVTLNALVSLGLSANIYEAYYSAPLSTLDCNKDVLDVLSGAEAPLGLSLATSLVYVTNPWGAVDNSGTPTTLTNGVGVAAYAKERIIFSSKSLPGDSLKIITSVDPGLLVLNLLTNFSIQRYLGGSPVGIPITSTSSFLNIKLLDAGTKAAVILAPMAEPYDAVEIRLGGLVALLGSININQIQRIATTKAIGSDANNYIEVCEGTNVVLPSTACTDFEWYEQATGGVPIYTGQTFNTVGLSAGNKTYYIQPVRYGCKNMPRGILTVKINPLTITLGTSPEICQGISSTTLPYSALTCATNYNISWDSTAIGVGFTPVTNGTFSGGLIPIDVPTGTSAVPNTYHGTLKLVNGTATSTGIPFTVKIDQKPIAPHLIISNNSQY